MERLAFVRMDGSPIITEEKAEHVGKRGCFLPTPFFSQLKQLCVEIRYCERSDQRKGQNVHLREWDKGNTAELLIASL